MLSLIDDDEWRDGEDVMSRFLGIIGEIVLYVHGGRATDQQQPRVTLLGYVSH